MRRLLTNKFIIVFIIILAIALPITIWQVQNSQDIRQRADSVQTIDTFLRPSSNTYPVGSAMPIEIVATSTHDIGSVEMTISYNPSLLRLDSVTPQSPLSLLTESSTANTKTVTLYNPTSTQVLGQNITLATFNFTALTPGNASVFIQPNIKYTATGVAGFIPVNPNSNLGTTYTITGTGVTPSEASPTTTQTVSPTQSVQSDDTSLNLNFTLSGIGNTATASQQLNTSPKRPQRQGDLLIYDGSLNLIDAYQFAATYNPTTGTYNTTVDLGNLPTGDYLVKARLDNTLFKFLPGIQRLNGNTTNTYADTIRLASGDIIRTTSSDNVIDIADYSALLSCLSANVRNVRIAEVGGPTCGLQIGVKADLNDDDTVDLKDLNILLRSFTSRIGD